MFKNNNIYKNLKFESNTISHSLNFTYNRSEDQGFEEEPEQPALEEMADTLAELIGNNS